MCKKTRKKGQVFASTKYIRNLIFQSQFRDVEVALIFFLERCYLIELFASSLPDILELFWIEIKLKAHLLRPLA